MLSLLVPCYFLLIDAVKFYFIFSGLFIGNTSFCFLIQSIAAAELASFNSSLDGLITFMGWLFLLCFFGNEVTNRFIKFSNSVYDVEWYCYPPEIRNCFQLIILASQRPIYVQGYLNFNCSLELFTKVSYLSREICLRYQFMI